MTNFNYRSRMSIILLLPALLFSSMANANDFREKGKPVAVVKATMTVTPPRDWNQLSIKPGKKAETWTLDGEDLNDITFYGAIAPGEPLVRERDKKRKPLPKLTRETLLLEIPDLLEATYRSYKDIAVFKGTGSRARHLPRAGRHTIHLRIRRQRRASPQRRSTGNLDQRPTIHGDFRCTASTLLRPLIRRLPSPH